MASMPCGAGLDGFAMALPVASAAAATKIDLHGIALGMTVDQVKAGANLPCTSPPYSSDLACTDARDGSDYRAAFSGGTPSVVLTVARSFCSLASPAILLDRLLTEFGKRRNSAKADPNGYHVDIDPVTEAILNAATAAVRPIAAGTTWCPCGMTPSFRTVPVRRSIAPKKALR